MSDIFTDDDYVKILRNRFETENVEFLKAERESFSEDVEGFMGEHFILNITYKTSNDVRNEIFFVKTLPKKSEYQVHLNAEFGAFVKETFLYGTLIEEFKKHGYDVSFAPKCYFCKNQETLVLENLRINDFSLYERGKLYDVEHCKESLKALASYHANSIALEETKTKELGRVFRMDELNPMAFLEIFFVSRDIESAAAKYIDQTKVCYKYLCQFVTESEEWKRNFFEKLDKFDCGKVFNQELKSRKTCCHGDLWSNNMLFRYKNGAPIECRLIDFQLLRHHHPVFDAILVIHLNTNREFKKKHLEDLVRFYYRYLCDCLEGFGLDGSAIMPEEDFFEAKRVLEPVAVFQAVTTRSFVHMPKDISKNLNKKDSDFSFQDMIENDRSKVIFELCKTNDKLKEMFIEDVYDLNDYI